MKDVRPIGLVGAGLVGSALARNLLNGGFGILAYDIDPDCRRAIEELGGRTTATLAEVGSRCDRVLLALLDNKVVQAVLFGPGGLAGSNPGPWLVIDTTTGDPDGTIETGLRLGAIGIQYLDATISGSSAQIADRAGVFMVGGSAEAYQAAVDILDCCAMRHVHVGGPGDGAKTKLASNLILGLNRAALAEGLVFAQVLGLDPQRFVDVIRHTPAYSPALDVKAAKMIAAEYQPQSRIAQHRKDLDIILEYAGRNGQRLPFSEIHHGLLRWAEEAGYADADNAAVIEAVRAAKPR
jgi:3-hydroxyisobutyrate dehydrogenase-like beta-hydroxyacid dehydrogenase